MIWILVLICIVIGLVTLYYSNSKQITSQNPNPKPKKVTFQTPIQKNPPSVRSLALKPAPIQQILVDPGPSSPEQTKLELQIVKELDSIDHQQLYALFMTCLADTPDSSMDLKENTLNWVVRAPDIVAMASVLVLDAKELFSDYRAFSINDIMLYNVCVDQEYRRRGIAQWMLDDILEWARQNGKTRIFLNVKTDNAPAIKLYLKNGFQENSDPVWNMLKYL